MKYTKYVFYDIECANCRNYTAKISSFGYVITDQYFNIIESKEIKINPEAPFYSFAKVAGKTVREIYVPENIESYISSPNYAGAYENIKKLFNLKDTLFIGYGNVSDAYYLIESNKRYNLENFNYKFIDLKDIYNWKYNCKRHYSLERLANIFNLNWKQKHNSLDDALITSKICKSILRKIKITDLYNISKLANAEYYVKEETVYNKNRLVTKIIYDDMKLPD